MRLTITLEDEHAARLTELAEATDVQAETLARWMLLTALDSTAGGDFPSTPAEVLKSIPGALENHRQGLADIAAGRLYSLDEL